nr:sulfate adenylyltransferase subunit CysN [Desulfuromonadales bacterium]
MAHASELIASDIDEYLRFQENKELLRFITCGSVDDGKSTLIGRLLYDSKLIFEDQLAAVGADSKTFGTQGDQIDLALLVDGLQAEREQGITIDVAYRYFSTDQRKFIVADTPGHEQYTRNMVTGASTAELAVILVDARKGVLTQTRRHSYIVALLGIRHVVLAVNKIDLLNYDQAAYEAITADYRSFAEQIGLGGDIRCIPLSALKGDNVFTTSDNTPWYDGPTLMEVLETVDVTQDQTTSPFRMPVQWVNRPNADFRGYSGTISSGSISPGDAVVVCPAATKSRLARIVSAEGEQERAIAGQAVTLVLEDEIDASRGDVIAKAEAPPTIADQFAAHLVWMSSEPMLPERQYLMKIGTRTLTAQVTSLRYKVNVNTLEHTAAETLELNEVAICNFALDREIAFDPYADDRETGSFILIDRFTNATVGAGMIDFPLRRASNIHWQAIDIDKASRAKLKGQRPCVLWFTGLSGAGKSTAANHIEQKLQAEGRHTYLLDGDNVRHGLNKDLGFTDADRVENIRRVAEVAKLMVDAGLIVLVSFISPFRSERRMARDLLEEGEFVEVFMDTPLEVCEERDPKGLYKRARAGEIKNFTGIDSLYETPENPEVTLKSHQHGVEDLADQVIDFLRSMRYV